MKNPISSLHGSINNQKNWLTRLGEWIVLWGGKWTVVGMTAAALAMAISPPLAFAVGASIIGWYAIKDGAAAFFGEDWKVLRNIWDRLANWLKKLWTRATANIWKTQSSLAKNLSSMKNNNDNTDLIDQINWWLDDTEQYVGHYEGLIQSWVKIYPSVKLQINNIIDKKLNELNAKKWIINSIGVLSTSEQAKFQIKASDIWTRLAKLKSDIARYVPTPTPSTTTAPSTSTTTAPSTSTTTAPGPAPVPLSKFSIVPWYINGDHFQVAETITKDPSTWKLNITWVWPKDKDITLVRGKNTIWNFKTEPDGKFTISINEFRTIKKWQTSKSIEFIEDDTLSSDTFKLTLPNY